MSWLSKITGINIDVSKSVTKAQVYIAKQTLGSAIQNGVATGLAAIIKANPSVTLASVQGEAVTFADNAITDTLAKLPVPANVLSEAFFVTEEPTLNTLIEQGVADGYITALQDAVGAGQAASILAAQGIIVPQS
jgi:hypothetical protein